MKRIFAMLVLLYVSAVGTQRLEAQACQVSLGTFASSASIRAIAVEGSVGAVFDIRNTEVQILDTTNPGRPVSRSKIPFGALDLAIDRQVLYAVDGGGTLWLYNVADPFNPAFIASVPGFEALDRVDVSGGIAIVRDSGAESLISLDVSNPAAIRQLAKLRYVGNAVDFALLGSTMYLTSDTDEIRTYSLAQLDRILLVGSVRFPGSTFTRIDGDGQQLLVLDSTKRLATIFDTTGVLSPVATNPYTLPFLVALSGCTQYLSSSTMTAYDIGACANGLCSVADRGLSLFNGRFSVRADWVDSSGGKGIAHAVRLTDKSGYFWFFDRTNAEVQVKLLDACTDPFNRFWFFGAGLTNIEVNLQVSDLKTGRVFRYTNPQGKPFAPIQDTSGIDVCP
ncbi:MAG: hypothetical protein NDJ92_16675 [Thermoanaerobaculia bacterium]|nr:hypothetical protein [Thermoanaerobaculia bacterium]